MRTADSIIFADECGQAHGLGGINGQIPTCAMSQFLGSLGSDRVSMLDKLFTSLCLRAFGQAVKKCFGCDRSRDS
jgi:hypothetical protein